MGDQAEARVATVDVGHLHTLANRLDVWESLVPETLKQLLHDIVGTVIVYQEKSHAKKGVKNPNEVGVKSPSGQTCWSLTATV